MMRDVPLKMADKIIDSGSSSALDPHGARTARAWTHNEARILRPRPWGPAVVPLEGPSASEAHHAGSKSVSITIVAHYNMPAYEAS